MSLLRRLVAYALNAPLDLLRRRALRGEAWASRGVQVRVAHVRGEHEALAQSVANALELIAEHDPNRMARIRRDLAGILVWPFVTPGAGAEFYPEERVCALDSRSIKTLPAAFVALSIVHEATHARLSCIHVTWENVARMENLCLKQELAFAARIPGGDTIVAYLRDRATASGPAAHTRDARLQAGLAALEQDGAPRLAMGASRLFARLTADRKNSPPAA